MHTICIVETGKKAPVEIYQIKIALMGSKPAVWRRILISGDTTLARLHDILQVVMGWTNAHLHRFIVKGQTYAIPDRGDIGPRKPKDERKFTLRDIAQEGSRLVYEYDFGDNWQHGLDVEAILPPEEGMQYPACLEGAGACPPEDVGGISGYEHFLEAMGDPKHPEHQNCRDWIGGTFDPQKFNLTQVNKIFRNIA